MTIAGQHPRRRWRANPDGLLLSIEEAVAIARQHGVDVPDDVEFFIDESDELDEQHTARSSRVSKPSGARMFRSDLVHPLTNKVPFRIWAGILLSDEAIVAVLAHEVHEVNSLRPLLQEGILSIDDYIHHTEPGRPGNFHDQAWDVADRLVDKMRGEDRP